jgi:hypothetical protein
MKTNNAFQSWSVARDVIFAQPAVMTESRVYALIQSARDVASKEQRHWIWSWRHGDRNVAEQERTRIDGPVFAIFPLQGDRLIVVYECGSVALVSDHNFADALVLIDAPKKRYVLLFNLLLDALMSNIFCRLGCTGYRASGRTQLVALTYWH